VRVELKIVLAEPSGSMKSLPGSPACKTKSWSFGFSRDTFLFH